ncbi:preprotein translocase subunit YajC [Streptomyces sp. NBC_01262]|uniref:preprotein translocase subunit YajC n=1 Tax=Streptomyces sp. NBC_01262 TaxID=2903803 RepID=UPI002E3008C5|nr:preprotein translocase subunit YajC [Streptomyces sp. NBC_01262]
MSIQFLFIIVVMFGAMFLMTRSAKNKQKQALEMRNQMAPGSGIRTIGGMYAIVKEVNDDSVLLELADGVHAYFAKNAIAAVLDEAEYDRVVHGIEPDEEGDEADEAGEEATEAEAHEADEAEDGIDLTKPAAADVDDEQPEDGPKTDGTDSK